MTNPFLDQAQFMRACGQTVAGENLVQAELYADLVWEEFHEFVTAGTDVERADATIDLIVVLIGYAHSMGWPLAALWSEVHRSNMAKVDPATGAVRRREDGKILKPPGWTPPDVAGVLAREVGDA
jgi:hypothetical protein